MEILLWLVPPVLVTLVAMAWVGWLGREGRGEVDHDEAVRRLGAALEHDAPVREPQAPRVVRRRQRSTGVALRRTPAALPAAQPVVEPAVPPAAAPGPAAPADDERRAS